MTATVEDLERRVVALERANTTNVETLKWVAGTLGQVKAVQDDHTVRLDRIEVRLDRIETVQDDHTKRLDRVESEIRGLRSDFAGYRTELPGIVADALREVLKKS